MVGRRRLTSFLLVSLFSLSSLLLIIWLILYRLVIKTLLSFWYILKWNVIALITAISIVGGLTDNRGVCNFRDFWGTGVIITSFSSYYIF